MLKQIATILLALSFLATYTEAQGSGSSQSGSGSQTGSNSQGSGTGGGKGGNSNSTQGNTGTGGGNGGPGGSFSIESEGIAYKSLESDSEAIGCDIFLALGLVDSTASGKCPFSTSKAANVKILIGSPTVFSNFQQWQAAMTIARLLLIRVNSLDKSCSDVTSTTGGRGGISPTDAMNAVQQGVSILQTVLGLFATNESLNGVTGTIQDQALVNAVARQLRVGGMQVIAPDAYPPKLLEMGDGSLFLNRLMLLLPARDCLQKSADAISQKITDETQAVKTGKIGTTSLSDLEKKQMQDNLSKDTDNQKQMTATISAIDQFITSLTAPSSSNGSQNNANNSQASKDSTGTNSGGTTVNVNPASNPNLLPTTGTPLMAGLLAADELAQSLQFRGPWLEKQSYIPGDMVTRNRKSYEAILSVDSTAATPPEQDTTHWQQSTWYVLNLKALESGGGVMSKSNLFSGTKVYFSGGAIATYALFQIDGNFVCSANLYDYDGYVREKDFQMKLRSNDIDPSTQLVLVRNPGCRPKK
jgi:hypothetical protein